MPVCLQNGNSAKFNWSIRLIAKPITKITAIKKINATVC